MAPRWERTETPPSLDDAPLFLDAVLKPHRSLSLAAFKVMLAVVIVANVVVSAVFISEGAFPVAGFMGLDVLALWIAFRVNYRAARTEERVRVAQTQMHLERRDPNGVSRHWVLNPIWAQVAHDSGGVAIRSGRDALRVGAFLSPDEQHDFAVRLRDALFRAKRGY